MWPDAYYQKRIFLRIAWLRLGLGVTKFLNQISPTWFPFILRSLMRVVPIETRSFNSYDFFIWLHHVTSCLPACLSILPDACNQDWVLWKSVNKMKRVSVRLVPIETRSFKSDDFFIWLYHVTSCVPACLVYVDRCI